MPITHLSDRAILDVAGEDAEHFLQNILTCDLDTLEEGEARAGALLTPQGKILFDFLISRNGADAFRLECRTDIGDDFLRQLTLYKLRAKARITKREPVLVAVSWQVDSSRSAIDSAGVRESRFPTNTIVRRHYDAPLPAADALPEDWQELRIANGIAESGTDYALGDSFPHDVLLDQINGVGFRKGCYVGQEVVSRMQHRGTARRRVLIAQAESALPASGTEILAGRHVLGTLGSVAEESGLAIVRIDRVKDAIDAAIPITADGTILTLAIPEWAVFGFPESAASASKA